MYNIKFNKDTEAFINGFSYLHTGKVSEILTNMKQSRANKNLKFSFFYVRHQKNFLFLQQLKLGYSDSS